jgi:hypothetical protein
MLGINRVELPELHCLFFFVFPRKTGKGFFVECFNGFNLSLRKCGKFVCPSPFRKVPLSLVQESLQKIYLPFRHVNHLLYRLGEPVIRFEVRQFLFNLPSQPLGVRFADKLPADLSHSRTRSESRPR